MNISKTVKVVGLEILLLILCLGILISLFSYFHVFNFFSNTPNVQSVNENIATYKANMIKQLQDKNQTIYGTNIIYVGKVVGIHENSILIQNGSSLASVNASTDTIFQVLPIVPNSEFKHFNPQTDIAVGDYVQMTVAQVGQKAPDLITIYKLSTDYFLKNKAITQ